MSHPNARGILTCKLSAALLQAGGGLPATIHLVPAGISKPIDGRRSLDLKDMARVIAASKASSPDGKLVIDVNHATDRAAETGIEAPARGWITGFEARDDGIWGAVEWTEAGKALLGDRAYRFISPVITYDENTGEVLSILRASLVNNPALHGLTPVLHSQEKPMTISAALLQALGQPADTGEAAVVALIAKTRADAEAATAALSAIGKLVKAEGVTAILAAVQTLADPAKMVPLTVVEGLKAELAQNATKLNAIQDAAATEKATAVVDGFIRQGTVVVASMREHYIAQHKLDPARVEKELSALPRLSGGAILPAVPKGEAGKAALSADDRQVARMLGVTPEAYAKARADDEAKREIA